MICKEINIIRLADIQYRDLEPDFFEPVPRMILKLVIRDNVIVLFTSGKDEKSG
jgi:hypothetical protein